jgi:iron complex transport system ATP-binding protein
MSQSVLHVHDVTWHAGAVPVIEGVSLDVAPGEFVALMGRNGAGKSTLLDIIAGLRAPTRGTVLLSGQPLAKRTPMERARVVAHLPQQLRAERSLDAESLVLMGRYAHHPSQWFESGEDLDAAHAAMRRCDCFEFRRRTLGTLSGGERQRVFLAACLAQRAPIVLLDEPATFLDIDQQLKCFAALRAEADAGTACIAVTHDVNLALTFCTRVVILAQHGIARDLPMSSALDSVDWLGLFSDRLRIDGASGRAWVRYQ